MTKIWKWIIAFLMAQILVFTVNCTGDEHSFIAPDDNFGDVIRIDSLQVSSPIVKVNGDSSSVSAFILNASEEPISGLEVDFTAFPGTFRFDNSAASAFTDSTGYVQATYFSGLILGPADIYVRAGTAKDTISVEVVTNTYFLDLGREFEQILADGFSSSRIYAYPKDMDENPLVGVPVRFAADRGSFPNGDQVIEVASDTTGLASVHLISEAGNLDQLAVIYATVVHTPALSANTSIVFQGINLTFNSDPGQLLANGLTQTPISLNVNQTTGGEPIVDAEISWFTTLGSITGTTVTDENGQTTAILTHSSTPGIAIIQVSYGVGLTAELEVEFVSP